MVKSKQKLPNVVEIELAISRHFNYRTNIIVPNVSWGLGLRYEADMVIVSKAGWADEVEIKVSAQDIRRDLNKYHCHDSKYFRRLWFAVPMNLTSNEHIPKRAGILGIAERNNRWICTLVRAPTVNKAAVKLDEVKITKLLHLGCMRIWTLKRALYDQKVWKLISEKTE